MKLKTAGIIFDFNGTMLLDTHLHRRAWKNMVFRITGEHISDQEFDSRIIGRDNKTILSQYIENIDAETVSRLSYEKEAEYRAACLEDRENFKLTAGLSEFLDSMVEKGIPFTVATSSEIENLEFYFEHLGLSRWFGIDKIVYDNGTFPGKPQPDIYLRAASLLGLSPRDCTVFEDAFSGVLAARRAGVGNVIAVGEGVDKAFFEDAGGVDIIVPDFCNIYKHLEF